MEKKIRSIVKSLTYRTTGIILMGLGAYVLGMNIVDSIKLTVGYHAIRIVQYYLHERIWNMIKWGKEVK